MASGLKFQGMNASLHVANMECAFAILTYARAQCPFPKRRAEVGFPDILCLGKPTALVRRTFLIRQTVGSPSPAEENSIKV
ncbi:hypothetical protein AS026_33770 [Rhizobium altiplani]|uniref:Uncharacterized protein n=1 Tax=Rhizobium altiplani TaxID=1864509 RepID=A0A109JX58_9HYPH|nr:hypothetical protein AS026_33770 [Rhizobium altiplani]